MGDVLRLAGLHAGHGRVPVIRELNLTVAPGEVVSLLGANGAGKSTTLRTVAGALPALGGDVWLDGERATDWPVHIRARRGLSFVPDDRGLFPPLTVDEHLVLAKRRGGTPVNDVLELFSALEPLRSRRCGLLSGGEQQMLTLAMAILRDPKLLLIDELTLGLAPIVAAQLFSKVRELATERGVAVLVVEQHVGLALEISDRVEVLAHGAVALFGSALEIRKDPDRLARAYLGDGPGPQESEPH